MANVSSITSGYEVVAQEGFSDSLNGAISSGATTVTLNSTSGYSDGDKVILTVDRVDSSGVATPSKEQAFYGEVSGNSIINVVWTEGSNQSHSDGAVVEDLVTATHHLVNNKWVRVSHNQDGTHKSIDIDAGTGNDAELSATGDDTNINLNLVSKGTGTVRANGHSLEPVSYNSDYTLNTTNWGSETVSITLVGNLLYVYIAAVTQTTIGDTETQILSMNLAAMGISTLQKASFTGYSDGGNTIAMGQVEANGSVETVGWEPVDAPSSSVCEFTFVALVTAWV